IGLCRTLAVHDFQHADAIGSRILKEAGVEHDRASFLVILRYDDNGLLATGESPSDVDLRETGSALERFSLDPGPLAPTSGPSGRPAEWTRCRTRRGSCQGSGPGRLRAGASRFGKDRLGPLARASASSRLRPASGPAAGRWSASALTGRRPLSRCCLSDSW